MLQVAHIYFKDRDSEKNRDLTNYLSRNLEPAIMRGGLSFVFVIVKPANMNKLRSEGFKKLPAMCIGDRKIFDCRAIIAEINSRIKTAKTPAAIKNEEEIVRDYQLSALGGIQKDREGKIIIKDEPESDPSADIMARYNKEISRRGASIGHANTNADNAAATPGKPARDFERELEGADYNAPANNGRNGGGNRGNAAVAQTARLDNIAGAEGAKQSLKRISNKNGGSKEAAQDDAMMGALLDRIDFS